MNADPSIDEKILMALELDRTIKDMQDQLKTLKAQFVALADKEDVDLVASNGNVVHVCFPDPGLIRGGFFFIQDQAVMVDDKKTVKLGPIKSLAGEHFDKLFAIQYKPAKAFRELAHALLPAKEAAKLIDLLEVDSSPRVTFETKTSAAALERAA